VSLTPFGPYTYDLDGNLTSGGGRSYGYSVFNVPNCISTTLGTCGGNAGTTTFYFDSEHQRTFESNSGGTATAYINAGGVLTELSSTGGVDTNWASYLMADGEAIGVANTKYGKTTHTITYYHTDHLGSIAATTTTSTASAKQQGYDPWGKLRNATGTSDPNDRLSSQTRYGYTDREELSGSALIHLNGRVYDPQIGKFTSADPTTSKPYSTQGWNRYAYTDNNPLNATDPTGFSGMVTTAPCLCGAEGFDLTGLPGYQVEQAMAGDYHGVDPSQPPSSQSDQQNNNGSSGQTQSNGTTTYTAAASGNPAAPSSKSSDEAGSGGAQKTAEGPAQGSPTQSGQPQSECGIPTGCGATHGSNGFPNSADKYITPDVDKFNKDHGYAAGSEGHLDPKTVKAVIMVESGHDLYAYLTGPMQVNKNGDWPADNSKAAYGLTKGMPPGQDLGIKAGIGWLASKHEIHDSTGSIIGFRSWDAAIHNYNGGGDPDYDIKFRSAFQSLSGSSNLGQ